MVHDLPFGKFIDTMRIQHKYLRNRHFRLKNWKRIRNTEHPFETDMPWFFYNSTECYSAEKQIANHFERITNHARGLESGFNHVALNYKNAPSDYRRRCNARDKAKVRAAMQKINNGQYETELPVFKQDAGWDYW